MNWQRLINRLRGDADREQTQLDEELAFHAEMKARELAATGLPEADARHQARRAIGNMTLVREQVRETWSFTWLSDAAHDARYGARGLAAQPAFTIAAVLALVLGIGVNAILFNVYNALALAPFAIRNPSDTVQVWAERGRSWNGFSWPEFHYLREQSKTLSALVAATSAPVRVTRRPGETAWSGEAAAVSENYFDVIGTGFTYGRGFSREAARAVNPAPEIVLHHSTWVARFGADPRIVGEWIEVNGHRLQVVGVAAQGFSGAAAFAPQAWIPGPWRDVFNPDIKTYQSADHCCVSVLARLKEGVTGEEVQSELSALRAQFPQRQEGRRVRLTRATLLANPKAQAEGGPMFVALAVAALLILLLACANVANLQIARTLARRREISMRLALGATRGRLLRQMLVESLLVASIAGIISAALSAWAPGRIVEFLAAEERGLAIRFDNDGRVIAFLVAVTALAAVFSGLAPAWTAVRQFSGARVTASGGRLRPFLLACQVALSAILVSGTALLVRVAYQARQIDPGFSYENAIVVDPGLNSSGVSSEQARALLAGFAERVRSIAGVESLACSIAPPLGNTNMSWGIRDARGAPLTIAFDMVSPGYFETLRVPLLSGRDFREGEKEAVIVNQVAAERLWPGQSPLGKTIPGSRRVVVGMVGRMLTRRLSAASEPQLWVASAADRDSKLLIRHAPGARDAILNALPPAARQLDTRFFLSLEPYRDVYQRALRAANMAAAMAALLGSLALLLACVGIYGVAAYNVSQGTREFGVRIALGAAPSRIGVMVLRQTLLPVAIGACTGIAGAVAFARLLSSILHGVAPADPAALGATIAILIATALIASWAPAQRAARIDPSVTLRQD